MSQTLRRVEQVTSNPNVATELLREYLRAVLDSVQFVEYGEVVISLEALAFRLGNLHASQSPE